ncbi:MAG: hypothetical protein BWX86_02830 [Verrucomicrobia bacterium ADurb.Bin122]|nr:MAG: hypothetical protein BWX86_02830 [Verrucomicrobia bacterium ADurb.Bin122]
MLARTPHHLDLGRRADIAHQTAHALQDIDRRIVILMRQRTGKHDVPIEDAAHGIGHRLIHVVALDQHRVKGCDRPALTGARALQQPGQHRKHARGVATRRRRLARRQSDLALRHRKAGDGVHQQKHILTLVAVGLGQSRGRKRSTQAQRRGRVAGGHDDHGARQSFRTEVLFKELADLTAALADERHDDDIGLRIASDHAQQRGLADTRACEKPETLAPPDWDEGIDRAHSGGKSIMDALAAQRVRRLGRGRIGPLHRERTGLIERPAQRIEHPAEQLFVRHRQRHAIGGHHLAARMQPGRVAERHQQHTLAAEAHDLGHHRKGLALRRDAAEFA